MSVEDIFRAYDVRGVYGEDLTPDVALRIGRAFGTHLGGKGAVCLGRDGRTSSPVIARSFSAGLSSTGVEVHDIGMVPIPVSNFATMRGGFAGGAYITASHNPPRYNGVRFRHPDGSGYTEENGRVKEMFLSGQFGACAWDAAPPIEEPGSGPALREYTRFLTDRIAPARKLKVVIDAGNGVGGISALPVFRRLGFEVHAINSKVDGRFPNRSPHPTDESVGGLKRAVKRWGADFGVAYDGDADRVLFVDDGGRAVQTEKIGVLLARQLLKERPAGFEPVVLANVPCSMLLEDEIGKAGGTVKRVRVGDVFVCQALKATKAVLGVEISAHLFLPTFYIFDDPLLASLKAAEILSKGGEPLSRFADSIPSYPMVEKEIPCPDAVKFQVVERVTERFRSAGARIDLTDGVKVVRDDSWALVRPSNTQPIIRLFAEARTREGLDALVREFEVEVVAASRSPAGTTPSTAR